MCTFIRREKQIIAINIYNIMRRTIRKCYECIIRWTAGQSKIYLIEIDIGKRALCIRVLYTYSMSMRVVCII